MEVRYPTCYRGETAQQGHRVLRSRATTRFPPLQLRANDPSYGGLEFVAVGPLGGGHYIGVYKKIGKITCGPKGYHYLNGTPICSPHSEV